MSSAHYHEAAHAVVALSYGARVSRLQIGEDRLGDLRIAGVCSFHPGTLSKHAQAEIYLAGPLAEQMLDRYWNVDEVKNDYTQAVALLGGADPKPIVDRTRQRVHNLWPEIARLAQAQLERKVMDEARRRN